MNLALRRTSGRSVHSSNGARSVIRRYEPADFDAVNDLWRRARLRAFPDFQARKGHTAEEDREYFRDVVLVRHDVWVAELDGQAAGFLAIAGDFIDQLYIDPDHQRKGIGRALIAHARALSPSGLRLFTFQINHDGRAFYESQGFVAVRLGISPAPESEPDIEYHWKPQLENIACSYPQQSFVVQYRAPTCRQ